MAQKDKGVTRAEAFEAVLESACSMITRAGAVYNDAALKEGAALLRRTVEAVKAAGDDTEEIRKILHGE